MRYNIRCIAAVAAAVTVLLTVQTVTARSQEQATRNIVRALRDYEVAAKHGSRSDREAALAFLLQVLRKSEGR